MARALRSPALVASGGIRLGVGGEVEAMVAVVKAMGEVVDMEARPIGSVGHPLAMMARLVLKRRSRSCATQ